MTAEEVLIVRALPGNYLLKSKAQPYIQNTIINPYLMFHSKGPEREIVWTSFCPMKGGVNHKYSCHIHDGLNSTFSMHFLVLGTNAREWLTLSFLFAITPKVLRRENTIITMIVLDFTDTLVIKPLLKTSLSHYCFVSTKRHLFLDPNESWCCIIKDGTTLKTAILWFTSIPGWQTFMHLTDELVGRDKITNVVLIPRDSSFTIIK